MTNIQLSTENLSFTYPDGTRALKNINIEIEKGEKVAIIGPNGAGKSTLFSHFNGLTEPTSGCVKIEGKPISFEKDELLKVRQKVGIVFQDPNDQLFAPTVKEDIAFGPMNLGLSYDEVEKRVEDALKMVGMENYEDKTPHHLSGGQQKRIAIAGIIAMKPELMILDEPTAGLDPDGVEKVLNITNQLNEEGMTLIISSHDIDMISKYADKILYNCWPAIATKETKVIHYICGGFNKPWAGLPPHWRIWWRYAKECEIACWQSRYIHKNIRDIVSLRMPYEFIVWKIPAIRRFRISIHRKMTSLFRTGSTS